MKNFYKISGIVFVVGCLFFLKYNYRELEAYKNGYYVIATVVFVPDCFTTKRHYNIKFNYNGKLYAKEIGVLTCKELKEGDVIKLKTNNDNDVFLYEHENPNENLVSIILLFLFGLFLIFMGFKK